MRWDRRYGHALGWSFAFLVFLSQVCQAAVPVTREMVLEVAREIHPPGCPDAMTGEDCQMPAAFELRSEVAQLLGQGLSKEEVIDRLVQTYGQSILAAPPKEGWHLVAWYLPYGLISFAGGGVLFWLLRWVRRRGESNGEEREGSRNGNPPLSAEEKVRIEQELKRYL